MEEITTSSEVAAFLRDHVRTVYRLAEKGAIDILFKPVGEMDLVPSCIDRAIQKKRVEKNLR